MSILIKGGKMPKNCKECPLVTWEYENLLCGVDGKYLSYDWDNKLSERRHPDCPLVEIPPHGKLIDADDLQIERNYFDTYNDYITAFDLIDYAQIIIEAEDANYEFIN